MEDSPTPFFFFFPSLLPLIPTKSFRALLVHILLFPRIAGGDGGWAASRWTGLLLSLLPLWTRALRSFQKCCGYKQGFIGILVPVAVNPAPILNLLTGSGNARSHLRWAHSVSFRARTLKQAKAND